jgi:hypothetical protein
MADLSWKSAVNGINKQTFYNWKKKYAGMSGEHLRQLKQLQERNVRLKQMYADASLDNKMLHNTAQNINNLLVQQFGTILLETK